MLQQLKRIGTHNGQFHVDEVLASAMLIKYTKEFKGGMITRTRDPQVWKDQDILIDVGDQYNPEQNKYDHHQKEFNECFSKEFNIRMSSAGLIYKHFGLEVIQNIIEEINNTTELTIQIPPVDQKTLEAMYLKLYKNFIITIDAIDNGISQYPNQDQKKYPINCTLASMVSKMNPQWCEKDQDEDKRFQQALELVNTELVQQIKSIYLGWYPGRVYVEKAYQERSLLDETQQILKLDFALPWKSHIYDLEEETKNVGQLKFVLFPDRSQGWRVQAVSVQPESFENRVSLPEQWRGVRDIEKLKQLSGIEDIIFVHQTGFIGGAKSFQSVLKMAKLSLN